MKKLILSILLITSPSFAGLPPTGSRVSGESVDATTFSFRFPNFTGTRTGTAISLGVNSIAGGGTNSSTALTNNKVMVSTGGAIVESAVSTTSLGYLDATSSIQTQLNAKASTTLNNLGTTAINADLIPSGTRYLGSFTNGWSQVYANGYVSYSNSGYYSLTNSVDTNKTFNMAVNWTTPATIPASLGTANAYINASGSASVPINLGIYTVNFGAADTSAGGSLYIATGNRLNGTSSVATSGDIKIATGSISSGSGTRGTVTLDGSQVIVSSDMSVVGAYQGGVSALSGNTSLDDTHQYLTVDASGAARTITLPDCVSGILGRTYHIKKIDSSANAVNIARTGSDDTFDGSTSYAFNTQYQSITLVCVSTTLWGIF